jgi:hypothetical protein
MFILGPLLGLFGACQPVNVTDLPTLSRPALSFTASGPRTLECGLSTQMETGRAGSSTNVAGGCSSCQ